MTFGDMLDALRRYWLAVVAFTLVALAVAAAAATIPETKYEARATLLAQPDSEVVDFASVEAVRFILPSLAQLVSTNTFRGQIGQRFDPPIDPRDIEARADFEPGTGIVHITGTDASPTRAQRIAEVAAALLGRQELSSAVSITLLDPPELPTSPAGPGTGAYLLGGLVLGVLGGIILAIVLAAVAHARGQRFSTNSPGEVESVVAEPSSKPVERATEDPGARSSASAEVEPTWANFENQAWKVAEVGGAVAATQSVVEATRHGISPELGTKMQDLAVEVIGAVPVKGASVATEQNGASDFDGSFRALAHRLQTLTPAWHHILVVSARAGAGSTTVAANAAWALATGGTPVVAVDADIESPMLHRFLRVSGELGLANVPEVPAAQVLQEATAPSLRVVAAGTPSSASPPSLGSALSAALQATGDDLVVVDGPALLESAVALSVAGVARTVLLVIDAADARAPADLEAAVAQLNNAGAELLGVVLNRVSA